MSAKLNWTIPQHCIGCQREMRQSKTPADGRPEHRGHRYCSRCHIRVKNGTDLFFMDWSVPQYCIKCSKKMRHRESKPNGSICHAGNRVCVNCSGTDRRRRKGIGGRSETQKLKVSTWNSQPPVPCPNSCGREFRPNGLNRHLHFCKGLSIVSGARETTRVFVTQLLVERTSFSDLMKRPDRGKVYIYALVDTTDAVRYVGKTVMSPSKRLSKHYLDAHSLPLRTYRAASWVRSVEDPIKILILGTYDEELWEIWEKYWISALNDAGAHLTNTESGGLGGPDRRKIISSGH